jgi:uncharacterized protein YjiS (DUF1127 family)
MISIIIIHFTRSIGARKYLSQDTNRGERVMLARTEFEIKIKDYQSLTPEGQALLRDEAMARARAERALAISAFFRAVGRRLRRAVSRRWAEYRTWRERRAAVATLLTFDDRQLKDIGLRRSEIPGAVYGYNSDDTRRERGAEPPAVEVKHAAPPLARPTCGSGFRATREQRAERRPIKVAA